MTREEYLEKVQIAADVRVAKWMEYQQARLAKLMAIAQADLKK